MISVNLGMKWADSGVFQLLHKGVRWWNTGKKASEKDKQQRSEQIQQVSTGLRDVLGRKEHLMGTWAEIEATVDERMN